MSNGYGIDIYGLAYYGYSQPANYSVAPFVASQTGYGEITLTWASPNTTSWKYLELVRSTYGYPTTALDGVVLTQITPTSIAKSYDDPELTPGTIYYYTMFITVEAPTWASGTSYALNAQVLYNGNYWTSTGNGNTGNTPTAGSTHWSPSAYIPTWFPAGYAATLAMVDQGYSDLLYNRTPQPYKISTSDTFTDTDIDNQSLANYLSLFGFGLDMLKTSYDSYLTLNDPDSVSATSLDILGQQLGLDTDYLSTPQQRRQRVKNATVNYQMKGQTQSLHNLIAELSGWDSSITYGPNMFNSGDQTSFAHPMYDSWNVNSTYFVGNLVQYNGYNYKCLVQAVGQAQAPTGVATSNTWWMIEQFEIDTTINLNPETGGFSTWSIVPVSGTAAAMSGVVTGLPHPTNTAINNWNALQAIQTTNFILGSYNTFSTATLTTPNYSATANYVINNYVLYTDGYYYRAAKPSGPAAPDGVVTPGTNQQFWQPFYYTTSDNPNIIRDGCPIGVTATWNTTSQYEQGDQVQYFGIIYQATQTSLNSQPSGNYYSNADWVVIQPAQTTLVASSYWVHGSNTAGTQVNTYLDFYDINGNLINNTASNYTGYNNIYGGAVARFATDYPNMNNSTEPALVNASSVFITAGESWTSTPSAGWQTSYGMASPVQSVVGTTTYAYTLQEVGTLTGRFGLTFASDYIDTVHYTHGLIYAWTDSTDFWYVTRTSLRKVVSGTDTLVSSWTRLNTGDRILVDVNPSSTVVYKYDRLGAGHLTILAAPASGPGSGLATGYAGLIQKYSATGAL